MKNCFGPFLEEDSTSPRATIFCLADAIQIIYSNTPSSSPESNMDPDRKELCDFVAVSHQKLSRHFVQFHEETGDFKVDLACNFAARVTVLQSSNACLATEGQRRNSEFNVLMDRFLYQGRQDSFCFIRYQQGLTSQYAPCYLGSQFLSFCLIYLLNQKDTGRHFKRRT